MFKVILKHAKVRIDENSGKKQIERRELLRKTSPEDLTKVKTSELYYLFVREQMIIEEKIYEEISNYLLEELGFT